MGRGCLTCSVSVIFLVRVERTPGLYQLKTSSQRLSTKAKKPYSSFDLCGARFMSTGEGQTGERNEKRQNHSEVMRCELTDFAAICEQVDLVCFFRDCNDSDM